MPTGEVVGDRAAGRRLSGRLAARGAGPIKALVREVPVVSDRAEALDVLEILQKSEHHMALVYDEYGHFEGIVTTGDVLEAITGAVAAMMTTNLRW
jgi:putative hemolysin